MYPSYMALLMLLLYLSPVCAQDTSLIKDHQRLDSVIQHLPIKYLDQTAGKARKMQQRVDQYSLRTLIRLQKQKTRMTVKLAKVDAVAANNIFNHSIDSLGALNAKFRPKISGFAPTGLSGGTTGYLDTLQTYASDRQNIQRQPRTDSNKQGAQVSKYSKEKKRKDNTVFKLFLIYYVI